MSSQGQEKDGGGIGERGRSEEPELELAPDL
jgi:hypothetical protein